MNVESINPSTWYWLDVVPAAIMVAGFAVVFWAAMSGRKKTAISLGVVFLAALVGSAIAAVTVENDTRAGHREVVYSHFEKSYGLELEEVDVSYLRDVGNAGVTRDLKTEDGRFKHVLFRVVDGKVLPYIMDGSDGSWNPMPEKVDAP